MIIPGNYDHELNHDLIRPNPEGFNGGVAERTR